MILILFMRTYTVPYYSLLIPLLTDGFVLRSPGTLIMLMLLLQTYSCVQWLFSVNCQSHSHSGYE